MMNKSCIEWCDFTWNPVTGCRHDCRYCYAAKQAWRFAGNVMINKASAQLKRDGDNWILHKPFRNEANRVLPFPAGFEPTLREYTLPMPAQKKKPAIIFVVSMGDLFGRWVPDEWIEKVFAAAQAAPQHVYLFLTKNPTRYIELAEAGKLPKLENFWYGTTVTHPDDPWFYADEYHTFISVEPIQQPFDRAVMVKETFPDWVIIGAETGQQRDKVKPESGWIKPIIATCREYGTPVFLKDNLAPYWNGEMLQEMPESFREIHSRYAPHVDKLPKK